MVDPTPKLELTKAHPDYYRATPAPRLVAFGPLPYLSASGQGEPEGEAYTAALTALYRVAYGVKRRCKSEGHDFVVPKLEGLWWVDESETLPPLEVPRERWLWRLLLRLPDFVTEAQVQAAKTAREGEARPIRFESLDEGTCVQILHLGPYSAEQETLEVLDSFIEAKGLRRNGLHHEIYLTDPRRSAPQNLRTILRQPVR